jgi:drug/metabolite transporter (DMT)-like permease
VEPAAILRRDLLGLILAAVCWGLGTVFSKAALAEIPPVSLLAIQLVSSLVVLAVLMRRKGIALRAETPQLLSRLGLLNPGLSYALGMVGLVSITASVSVLLWALEPVMILFLAGVVLRERITPPILALSAAAVLGVGLVIYDPGTMQVHPVGVALSLAGVACCAIYTVATRRFIPDARETSQVVFAQQGFALVFAVGLAVVVALLGAPVLPERLSALALSSAVISGTLYYAGAYWLYLSALRRVPASIAAGSFYLIPIVGVTGGAVLLGERLSSVQWLGAAVVLASVFGILVRSIPRTVAVPVPAQRS